jgi:hypothetical protein
VWNVQVEAAGNYRIELRRWPFHSNKPVGSEGPRVTINGRKLDHKFRIIPATEVLLEANGVQQRVPITAESTGAVFQVALSKGRSKLQGWFRDADGKDLCGAYYALVTRL